MSQRERAHQAARTVIAECLALPSETELAIVADETTWRIARVLADAAAELNCRVHLMFFSHASQERLATQPLGESVKAALREVSGTILCVNGSASCLTFRDNVRRAAWGRGRKVAHMPGATLRSLLAADADYARITRECEGLALALAKGSQVVIQSFDRQKRTHVLRATLQPWQRLPIISDGIIRDGAWGNVPSGETYVAPIEDTAEGEIVINGSLPGMILMPRREIVLEFQAGRLVRLSPEKSLVARHLFKTQINYARDHGDSNWSNLAEIGLGVNKRIRRLTGSPLLDEKKYGSVHIALGDSMDMGGQVESRVHCDMVCLHPRIWVDDRLIVADGKIVLDEADWREDYQRIEPPVSWRADGTVSPTTIETRIDERGRLRRCWDTSAGGMCSVPVGTDDTAVQAAQVWHLIKENAGHIRRAEVAARLRTENGNHWERYDVDRLIWLLEIYGLVQTD